MGAASLNDGARCSRVDLATVTEGATPVDVPAGYAGDDEAGPSTAGGAFYNPAMALTRDLTVLAARAEDPGRRPGFLDGLAATGVRGLRVAREAEGWSVTLNDRSGTAAEVAERNADRLDAGPSVVVRRRDLNALTAEGAWAFADVDPYGSPAPFLAAGVRAVHDGGLLSLTATDTAALHGVEPPPARRRYLAEPPPRRAAGWKAAASRLLVGAVVREAARCDRAAQPVLVHHHQHAVRATVRVTEGARAADEALERVREAVVCPACQGWGEAACPCGEGEPTGPYWLGPLHDAGFARALLEEVDDDLAEPGAARELLERAKREAELGPFPLAVDRAVEARDLGGPPARANLREALADAGIESARTHYAPTTLAYDGDPERVLAVLDEVATRGR
jgi:tRNA (guanine26-N2/guanine27-N2)-dimethyltransferase